MGRRENVMLDKLLDFEMGELSGPESLELFAELVNTGMAWQLQGHYGREAVRMLEAGALIVVSKDPLRVEVNAEYLDSLPTATEENRRDEYNRAREWDQYLAD
jgi:hypothetical protein